MFRQVAARYAEDASALYEEAMAKPTLYEALSDLFSAIVEFLNRPGYPPGCLTVMGALATSSAAEPVQQLLLQMRTQGTASAAGALRTSAEGWESCPRQTDIPALCPLPGDDPLGTDGAGGKRSYQGADA